MVTTGRPDVLDLASLRRRIEDNSGPADDPVFAIATTLTCHRCRRVRPTALLIDDEAGCGPAHRLCESCTHWLF